MVAIVDYGVGNLFSLKSSFARIGQKAVVTGDADLIRTADRLLLPGVGAFEDAAKKLRFCGLDKILIEEAMKGKPLLGVCLGMQLLFEKSYEYGEHPGLGLIPGSIQPIRQVIPNDFKIPHIGWNSIFFSKKRSEIFRHLTEGDYVYFVHSYYAVTDEKFVTATTSYGAPLTAAVQKGRVFGCQFHPEKSGNVGLNILRAFCEMEEEVC